MFLENKKYRVINYIKELLFLVLIYLMCTRYNNKYENIVILIFGVITILERNFILKEKVIIKNKCFLISFILWIIFMTISFMRIITKFPKLDYHVELYENIMLYGVFFFYVILNLKNIRELINKNLLKYINFLSLYLVYKGINFVIDNGILVRGEIWKNANHYSMILGIFLIISFVSFLYEEIKIYKFFYLILNMIQFFLLISVGQSRNVLSNIILLYLVGGVLYLSSKNKFSLKRIFTYAVLGIIVIFSLFFYLKLKSNFRVLNIGMTALKNDPRFILWKIGLFDEKFNIFLGKGYGYYIVNKIWGYLSALHNDYIEILVTQGIFTLIFYLGFMISSLYIILKKYLKNNDIYLLITTLLLLYFLGIGMLDNPLYQKRIFQFLFLFLGITLRDEFFDRKIKNSK